MKRCINSIFFYFLFPFYFALALLLFFFNVPEELYYDIFLLFVIITIPVFFSSLFFIRDMQLNKYFLIVKNESMYSYLILPFCLLIVLSGLLDIYINGLKLLNPSTYAEFNGMGRYIRHVSLNCWVLIPVTFIFIKNPFYKFLFLSYGLLFPVLIIDRNRLFISCYSLFFCMVMNNSYQTNSKIKKKFLVLLLPIFCFAIFSIVGKFRSGSAFHVATSGDYLVENAYPLSYLFYYMSDLIQQIVLYVTTPIFNFATVASWNYINPDFLLSQLAPFSRDNFDAYPYAPILIQRFNVGTEFYPFLLYGGLGMVTSAYIFLLASFVLVYNLFKKFPNIYTLLIFLKVSYSALFMGFAPQFYILLNLMFILSMLFLWFFSELSRRSFFLNQKNDSKYFKYIELT